MDGGSCGSCSLMTGVVAAFKVLLRMPKYLILVEPFDNADKPSFEPFGSLSSNLLLEGLATLSSYLKGTL